MAMNSAARETTCGCAELRSPAAERCCCGVDDLVHVIGRKYAMPILNRVGRGEAHFTELQRALRVSSSTLSETLEDLVRLGLVQRFVLDGYPPRTRYTLTTAGSALRDRLRPLLEKVRQGR